MNASEILTTIFDNLQTATARRFRDGSEQIPMLEWEINAPSLARAPAWMRAANRAQNALLRAGDAGVFTLHASHGSMYLRIRAPLRECSTLAAAARAAASLARAVGEGWVVEVAAADGAIDWRRA